jgi:ABC-type Fe3+/spermidine/putrescine transport system ATPase subunit
VTHDVDEAASLSHRVLLLHEGRKVQEGTIDELYRRPANLWAARFLGDVLRLSVAQARECGIGLPEGWSGDDICFRPEDLAITPVEDQSDSLPQVVASRPLRATCEVTLSLADGTLLLSTSPATTIVSPDQKVQARVVRALPAAICREKKE